MGTCSTGYVEQGLSSHEHVLLNELLDLLGFEDIILAYGTVDIVVIFL
jgi:hypothetical protein